MTPKCAGREQSPLDAAYRYLAYRPRSEYEVRVWLGRKGFSLSTVESTISALRKKRLLDDAAFARYWRESRESTSPRSRAALRSELRRKGIDADLAAAALDGMNEEDAAYRAAKKRASKLAGADRTDFRARLSAVLMRRGFSYDVTEHTVNRLWQESVKNA